MDAFILQVTTEGACISGPDKLQVEANSTAIYSLTFEPTLNGKTTGQLVFICLLVHCLES